MMDSQMQKPASIMKKNGPCYSMWAYIRSVQQRATTHVYTRKLVQVFAKKVA